MKQKRKTRSSHGGMLILSVAIFLGIILVFAFVAMNYNQLFGYQKQAQSAVDASVLAVAKQVQKVTILHPRLGRVGVVDQYGSAGLQQRPVLGINTLLGTVRLDAIIANQMGNTTMIALATNDLSAANDAAEKLAAAVKKYAAGGTAQDADGKTISAGDIRQIACDNYNANNRRSQKKFQDLTPNDFKVEVGGLNPTSSGAMGVTNIPCPQPESMDGLSNNGAYFATINGKRYYRAYVPIPSPAGNINLSAEAEQIRLVDKGLYQSDVTLPSNAIVPTVVKVTVQEKVIGVAPERGTGPVTQTVVSVACAQMGSQRLTATAGLLRVEFPQGMPPVGSPAPFANNPVSVVDIANAAQISRFGQGGSPAPWAGNGGYFTAQGGAFPGSGQVVASNFLGRNRDNPSISLSFFIYDWLRNEGLKPNVACVDRALRNTDLRNAPLGQITAHAQDASFLMQPAYAQGGPVGDSNNVYGAIFNMRTGDATMAPGADPRWLGNATRSNQQVYVDQAYTFRMQSSVPQQLAWAQPSNTVATGMDSRGNTITVDGNPVQDLYDMEQGILDTRKYGNESDKAAQQVLATYRPQLAAALQRVAQAQAALTRAIQAAGNDSENDGAVQAARQALEIAQAEANRLQRIVDRATVVANNGQKAVRISNAIQNSLLAITALGCKKKGHNDFVLSTRIPFYPPARSATQAEIIGEGVISTSQVGSATGSKDWANADAYFAQNAGAPATIGKNVIPSDFFPPAIAQSVVPSSLTRNFRFVIAGDSHTGGGCVVVSAANTGPISASNPQSCLRGQMTYQAMNAYAEPPTRANLCTIYWSIMARNNSYSSDADVRKPPKAGDPESEGNVLECTRSQTAGPGSDGEPNACDSEVVQWQFTSPLPVCPPPPIPPNPPPGESH